MADGVSWLYICMEVLIAVASVIGNVMVVWAVKINKSLRDTTFCFVVSLAVADIAVGALVIPLAITVSIGLETHFYSCLLSTCIMLVLTQSSILALLAIAIDRYLRVKIPTRYKRVVTSQRAALAVVVCWTVAFIVGLTPMLGWNKLKEHQQQNGSNSSNPIVTCKFEEVIGMDYMVYFNFFGWVLPPLLLMLVIYIEIFYMIHKQLNNKKITSSYSDPNKYYDKELNLAKSLVLVLVLFAISWLPLHIINCITLFCKSAAPQVLLYISILLTHGNSAVNPIVYAFRIKKFRTAFHKILQQYFCCKKTQMLDFQQSDRKDMTNMGPPSSSPQQPTHIGDFKSYPPLELQQQPPQTLQEEQKIKTPQQTYNFSHFTEQNAS
ncbi:PREDICTED: adenosine receptor A1-like [Cyprinodon variegatus]|uniref:Adenosine receptor A1 n=1 Tax=Cyprinodon variegatus TaxID=28743 RepID=A0A3Q2E495_CYPVA|nr:PREDICTED: adenosine receptor A1-like [Cyprinodon variegatus]